jgi:hypothetical protein
VTTCDCGDPHFTPGIGLVRLNTASPTFLTTPLAAEEQEGPVVDTFLAFSPDSEQLIFSRVSETATTRGDIPDLHKHDALPVW